MDNRRLFLAALLSLAVLVVWQFLVPPPPPPAPAPVAVATPAQTAAVPAGAPPGAGTAAGVAPAETAPPPAPAMPPAAAEIESRTVIENSHLRAEFSNRGAQLVSFRAKGAGVNEPGGLELVRERGRDAYPFALVGPNGAPLALNEALFVVEQTEEGGDQLLAFRHSGPAGAAVKRFRFPSDGTFRVEIDAPGQAGWGIVLGPGLRNLGSDEGQSQFARRSAIYLFGEQLETIDAQGADEAVATPPGIRWLGLQDTYFLTALIPETPVAASVLRPILILPAPAADGSRFAVLPPKDQLTKEQKDLSRDLLLTIMPAADTFAARAYFGPKQHDQLQSVGVGLERSIDWGMFGILAKFFRWALQQIHDHVVANYGWAIVLMTVVIKIVLLPLTHKSYVSMKKMQELNPKITSIRERWRPKLKDKNGKPNLDAQRKMQEEMNALFKAEGASPMSGCLPILLQMPILFAFYSLLSIAVELRGAPWILWIKDLSAADPYYVLPIVMGATQLIQQRMMPQAGDPMQRKLFQLMPILFTVLFLGFPSGLVLYWLVNNVLSIAQQGVYNHLQKRQAAAAA